MPRHAIRLKNKPPAPTLQEKYLRFWSQGELYQHPERFPPILSESFFGTAQPLALEVGCGTGEWLIALAASEPERNFLGVDMYPKALWRAVERAAEVGLDNVRFLRAPAEFLYPLLQANTLDAVFMHYPDPNLRNRGQHKLVNPAFFDAFARALRPGGTLSLITDHEALFFEELLPLIEADPHWERTHAEPFLVGYEPTVKSRYQLMWEKHAVPPLRLELRKREAGCGLRVA